MTRLLILMMSSLAVLMPSVTLAQDKDCQMYNIESSIFFMSDSVELTSTAEAIADQLVKNTKSGSPCIVDTLTVTGHADWKEIETSDPLLSFVRAMSVGDLLVQKGLVTDLIAVAGYGARAPSSEGNMISLQRRAEIKITMRAPTSE